MLRNNWSSPTCSSNRSPVSSQYGDTHALVIGIGHWNDDWHDIRLTRAARTTTYFSDHALLRNKVSIVFKQKHQHRRVQRVRKLDIAKLSQAKKRNILVHKMSAALRDVENTLYDSVNHHWGDLREKIFQAAADSIGFAKKRHKDWFDENDTTASCLLDELHSLHVEYINDKTSQAKKDRYNKTKQTVQAKLCAMKNSWWDVRSMELQAAADAKDAKTFLRELKAVYGPSTHNKGHQTPF